MFYAPSQNLQANSTLPRGEGNSTECFASSTPQGEGNSIECFASSMPRGEGDEDRENNIYHSPEGFAFDPSKKTEGRWHRGLYKFFYHFHIDKSTKIL